MLALNFDWDLFLQRVFAPGGTFWYGLIITVVVAVVSQIAGVLLGALALAASRSFWLLRALSYIYLLIFRGTPIIVQIFFIYFGANLFLGFTIFPRDTVIFGIHISGAILAGTVALSINEGAYMSEILRSGMDAVDKGQLESAVSLGMTRRRGMLHIVIPQAAIVIVPPLGNQFNNMIKATSLLSFIGVTEIFLDAQIVYATNFQPVEVLIAVALWYLLLTLIWTVIQGRIERKLGAAPAIKKQSIMKRFLGVTS